MNYDFQNIEGKWQKKWEENHSFEAENNSKKKKKKSKLESLILS